MTRSKLVNPKLRFVSLTHFRRSLEIGWNTLESDHVMLCFFFRTRIAPWHNSCLYNTVSSTFSIWLRQVWNQSTSQSPWYSSLQSGRRYVYRHLSKRTRVFPSPCLHWQDLGKLARVQRSTHERPFLGCKHYNAWNTLSTKRLHGHYWTARHCKTWNS